MEGEVREEEKVKGSKKGSPEGEENLSMSPAPNISYRTELNRTRSLSVTRKHTVSSYMCTLLHSVYLVKWSEIFP